MKLCGNVLVASVCLSVCLYGCIKYDNLQKPSRSKFIFSLQGYRQRIRVKVIYESQRVKVKVTTAKEARNFIFLQCKTLICSNSGSVENTAL